MTDRAEQEIPFLDLAGTTAEVGPDVFADWWKMLETGRFVGGEAVTGFESDWAAYIGTRHAVGVANGTDALHLVLRALGIGPGDDVVVPANTFVATVEAVVLAGARPRFADVDRETLLLTGAGLRAAATAATRAVVPVHLYGQPADMDEIVATARRLGIWVVEDAAQAHGATWRFRRVGSFGVAGCFSFYPGKNLGAFGDAGAVVTGDDRLAAAVRSMRDHGRAADGHHRHDRVGTNSRLDALQACVLSAKLPRLDGWNAARGALMQAYRDLLRDPVRLVEELPAGRGVHHLAVARVTDRDRVRDELDRAGIRTGLHYPTPCHRMAPYRRYADGPLPATEAAAGEIVSLPMYPHLRIDQVERVAAVLNAAASRRTVP